MKEYYEKRLDGHIYVKSELQIYKISRLTTASF